MRCTTKREGRFLRRSTAEFANSCLFADYSVAKVVDTAQRAVTHHRDLTVIGSTPAPAYNFVSCRDWLWPLHQSPITVEARAPHAREPKTLDWPKCLKLRIDFRKVGNHDVPEDPWSDQGTLLDSCGCHSSPDTILPNRVRVRRTPVTPAALPQAVQTKDSANRSRAVYISGAPDIAVIRVSCFKMVILVDYRAL
ncbi:hypothetical protein DOTSEDRAFT_36338 [Dothistroma septosporum NZE10]|uniref:Uncharacterized protein n=1 Tax=Dothistroma septosporum (strain NZE10 / CBS 128990) TaxID=675120 RepID=N1PIP2_DOTSN|nr:hypothetical protein DOTSEDRAFT_36338 [Dothistroma septosporum NZE10]